MSNVTLESISAVIKSELEPVNTKLGAIEETLVEHTKTLAQHTAALEQLLMEKKNRDDNKTVGDGRMDYLEAWAKQVGQKLGIDFKP